MGFWGKMKISHKIVRRVSKAPVIDDTTKLRQDLRKLIKDKEEELKKMQETSAKQLERAKTIKLKKKKVEKATEV